MIKRMNVCLCILLILLSLSACNSGVNQENVNSSEGESIANDERTYYSMDDFSSIVIGESTILDVNKITPDIVLLRTTHYGAVAEFPTIDGCIRIEFYGGEHVVRNIEEIKENTD